MGLFHHHDRETEGADPGAATTFEVLGDDGRIRRYARDQFDELLETTDAGEVQQQVDRGWVIVDERPVERGGSGPSGIDMMPEAMAMRAGGMFDTKRPSR